MKKNLFLSMSLLAIAGVWTSCSIDEEVTTPAQLQSREVTFGVQGATPQVVSRTTGTTAEHVDAFVVSGTDDKTPIGIEGIYGDNKRTLFWNFSIARSADGSYDYSPKRYYQNDVKKATFFAYSLVSINVTHDGVAGANVDNLNGEVDGLQVPNPDVAARETTPLVDGNSATFDYKVEKPKANGETSQEDLLVAWSDIDEAGIYGNKKVTLDFVHALSRVFVTGQNKTTTPVRIKNLELINLYEEGTVTVTGKTAGLGMQADGFKAVDGVVTWADHKTIADGEIRPGYAYVLAESGSYLEASYTSGVVSGDPKWLVSKEQGMMVIPQTLVRDFGVKAAADVKHSADVVAAAATNVAAAYKAQYDADKAMNGVAAVVGPPAVPEFVGITGIKNKIDDVVASIDNVLNGNYKYDLTENINTTTGVLSFTDGGTGNAGVNSAGQTAYKDAYEAAYAIAYRDAANASRQDDLNKKVNVDEAKADAVGIAAGIEAGKKAGLAKRIVAVAEAQRKARVDAIGIETIVEQIAAINTAAVGVDALVSAIESDLIAIKDAVALAAAADADDNGTADTDAVAIKTAYDEIVDAATPGYIVTAKTNTKAAIDYIGTASSKVADAISSTTSTNWEAVDAALDAAKTALTNGTADDDAIDKLVLATAALTSTDTELGGVVSKSVAVAGAEVASVKYTSAVTLADNPAVKAAANGVAADGTNPAIPGITALGDFTGVTAATAATHALAAEKAALAANIALSKVYSSAPTVEGVFALRVDYELSNITQTTYIRLANNFELKPSQQYLINLQIEGREINFDVKVAGFGDPENVEWLVPNTY